MAQAKSGALSSQARAGVAWDRAASMTFIPDPVNLAQFLSLETLSQHVWGTG